MSCCFHINFNVKFELFEKLAKFPLRDKEEGILNDIILWLFVQLILDSLLTVSLYEDVRGNKQRYQSEALMMANLWSEGRDGVGTHAGVSLNYLIRRLGSY